MTRSVADRRATGWSQGLRPVHVDHHEGFIPAATFRGGQPVETGETGYAWCPLVLAAVMSPV